MSNADRQVGFRTLKEIARGFARRVLSATAMGYDSGEPSARSVQGDEHFPYFKDPADLSEARTYQIIDNEGLNQLPVATSFAGLRTLPSIDVRGFRSLTLYTEFVSVDDVEETFPTIGIVPESAVVFEGRGAEKWVKWGVVDPVLRGSGFVPLSLDSSLEARSTAYRDCFIAQLDMSFQYDKPNTMLLTFDVSDKAEVRFLVGSVARTEEDTPVTGILVNFYYQLGR